MDTWLGQGKQEVKQNFGGETSYKMATWKTEKQMEGQH